MGQQVNVYRKLKLWPGATIEGWMPAPQVTDLYVDDVNGADTNDGSGWGQAYATIGAAMTRCATAPLAGGRGRVRIYVAPGSYVENVITPLNAGATCHPFGQLIAWNPTPRQSFGAAYIAPSTGVGITVRARGWLISGFEILAGAVSTCVVLDGANTNCAANGTQIENCLFGGSKTAAAGIDVTGNGAPMTSIIGCGFYNFHVSGSTATCIKCSSSATDQPGYWLIENCWFGDSDNLLNMNPRGFKNGIIRYNTFLETGLSYTAVWCINNTGGKGTMFYGNCFGGAYNAATYCGASTDEWSGNYARPVAGESNYGLTYTKAAA